MIIQGANCLGRYYSMRTDRFNGHVINFLSGVVIGMVHNEQAFFSGSRPIVRCMLIGRVFREILLQFTAQ